MLTSARLTLRLHRFEVGAAALGALLLGATALLVVDSGWTRSGCRTAASTRGSTGGVQRGQETAPGPSEAFASINESEGGKVLAAMAVLPFAVGLLAAVPLVGRELEARTAQTAWFLSGVAPPLARPPAAPGARAGGDRRRVRRARRRRPRRRAGAVLHVGRVERPHVARADRRRAGVRGARAGRPRRRGRRADAARVHRGRARLDPVDLRGGIAQQAWVGAQPATVMDQTTSSASAVIQTGWGWRTPDGRILDDAQGLALVPTDVASKDAGAVQPINSAQWLMDRGYEEIGFGVSQSQALGWAAWDVLLFGAIGIGALGAAAAVVDRRRPT